MGSLISWFGFNSEDEKEDNELDWSEREVLPLTKHWVRNVWLDRRRIGEFSVINGEYESGHSALKYLDVMSIRLPLDLLNGCTEHMISEHNSAYSPGCLYKWIANDGKHLINTTNEGRLLDTDFVCSGSILAYILTLQYERFSGMTILATKFNGTIYMKWQTQPEMVNTTNNNSKDINKQKAAFGGHRFHQYMTTNNLENEQKLNDFDPNFNHYKAVVRTRLTDSDGFQAYHSVLYSSTIDCLRQGIAPDEAVLDDFVELRTTLTSKSQPFKRLKWWADAYVKGLSTIYWGQRDHKFMVNSVEKLNINTVSEGWQTSVCINFLNDFLSHVKQVITLDDPYAVYEFDCRPTLGIAGTRLLTNPKSQSDYLVLPKWYIDRFY